MIAFEISIDGRRQCTAGIGDLDVASVITTWVRRRSHDPVSGEAVDDAIEEELALEVGGLAHDPDGAAIQIRWLREALQVGQVITLAVVEADSVDPPRTRERTDPAWNEERKRAYYERLKREYGEA